MQEQIERESVAITVKAAKLTAGVLAKALTAVLRKVKKGINAAQTPHGRQPAKKLMNHNCATNTIPLEGDDKLFDRVAKKWNVDYSFHKTGKDKYLLLFKSGQADAITAAFSEYTALYMKRQQDKRPPLMARIKQAVKLTNEQRKHKTRDHSREAVHNDR